VVIGSAIDMIGEIAVRIGGTNRLFGSLRSNANEILPQLSLLDLGCGHPFFIGACSSLGMRCKGVDLKDGDTICFSYFILFDSQ
jgi:2-polyprenyl-3-methyl-5-hydroxy-6-metoxy-1,4-benzoquinol methylase